ncbi:hypothetical protein MJO28_011767 [Puccinia striiformis f. sp. tritici]|nr:hypothetical protein Pst134EA_021341 [Puccinia striiformis f. sp. tritici]KAH9457465.1 hypothetical protein Pst134EA_021341 [Puccinia striiformis f. sp. tritici]KAI7944239.1 hypothetical protein MJO28_011767 [Puccinia striiformis f. sp. tritici]
MSLHRKLRVHQIFGGGTGIGKTIISTALSRASNRLGEQTSYLKPIGTGSDSDDKHVSKYTDAEVSTKCLYTFSDPVSPHLAAERTRKQAAATGSISVTPTDQELITSIYKHLHLTARTLGKDRIGSLYVETAGGVHSPTLAGNSQLEAFRPLRLPTILIGSPLLGGISSTISAYESLKIHGYDIDLLIVLKEEYYENYRYFERWSKERDLQFVAIDSPPELIANNSDKEFEQMNMFYDRITNPESSSSSISKAVQTLQSLHLARIEKLESMSERALRKIWWPFLQHSSLVNPSQVTVIDSAYKDCLMTHQVKPENPSPSVSTNEDQERSEDMDSLVHQNFDGSASWWTQSLGHANSEIALSAAHAAGRYGHVIFPSCVHEPALNLTEHMLRTVGAGWANRAFFSDNGSTGVEVALKMGLTSYRRRHNLPPGVRFDLGVIGLKGSYHGDTIGAMDASEKSVYNSRVDWYKGRGFWLDAPQIRLVDGQQALIFTNPGDQWGKTGWKLHYPSLHKIYEVDRRLKEDPLTEVYKDHIYAFLRQSRYESTIIPASLIIEPVVMGAGGMIFVDPLFQNVLISVVRNNPQLFGYYKGVMPWERNPDPPVDVKKDDWTGLPVIFDEVFSGLYRLGKPSAAGFLGQDIHPDIAVYSKILSAGTVPLSVTLAREEIFDAFRGDGPVSALLHGHSYTAHPVGCSVAHTGLKIYEAMDSKGSWDSAKRSWMAEIDPPSKADIWSFWGQSFVQQLTEFPEVEGAMTLGTVLAIYLKDRANSPGYTSCAAKEFLSRLQSSQLNGDEEIPMGLHARPLGNVAYLISSLNTPSETLEVIQSAILKSVQLKANQS